MRWYEKARQEWIAETLRVFGFIQRHHLMRKFGISMPQASADIQRFQKENSHLIKYDASAKRYVAKLPRPGALDS